MQPAAITDANPLSPLEKFIQFSQNYNSPSIEEHYAQLTRQAYAVIEESTAENFSDYWKKQDAEALNYNSEIDRYNLIFTVPLILLNQILSIYNNPTTSPELKVKSRNTLEIVRKRLRFTGITKILEKLRLHFSPVDYQSEMDFFLFNVIKFHDSFAQFNIVNSLWIYFLRTIYSRNLEKISFLFFFKSISNLSIFLLFFSPAIEARFKKDVNFSIAFHHPFFSLQLVVNADALPEFINSLRNLKFKIDGTEVSIDLAPEHTLCAPESIEDQFAHFLMENNINNGPTWKLIEAESDEKTAYSVTYEFSKTYSSPYFFRLTFKLTENESFVMEIIFNKNYFSSFQTVIQQLNSIELIENIKTHIDESKKSITLICPHDHPSIEKLLNLLASIKVIYNNLLFTFLPPQLTKNNSSEANPLEFSILLKEQSAIAQKRRDRLQAKVSVGSEDQKHSADHQCDADQKRSIGAVLRLPSSPNRQPSRFSSNSLARSSNYNPFSPDSLPPSGYSSVDFALPPLDEKDSTNQPTTLFSTLLQFLYDPAVPDSSFHIDPFKIIQHLNALTVQIVANFNEAEFDSFLMSLLNKKNNSLEGIVLFDNAFGVLILLLKIILNNKKIFNDEKSTQVIDAIHSKIIKYPFQKTLSEQFPTFIKANLCNDLSEEMLENYRQLITTHSAKLSYSVKNLPWFKGLTIRYHYDLGKVILFLQTTNVLGVNIFIHYFSPEITEKFGNDVAITYSVINTTGEIKLYFNENNLSKILEFLSALPLQVDGCKHIIQMIPDELIVFQPKDIQRDFENETGKFRALAGVPSYQLIAMNPAHDSSGTISAGYQVTHSIITQIHFRHSPEDFKFTVITKNIETFENIKSIIKEQEDLSEEIKNELIILSSDTNHYELSLTCYREYRIIKILLELLLEINLNETQPNLIPPQLLSDPFNILEFRERFSSQHYAARAKYQRLSLEADSDHKRYPSSAVTAPFTHQASDRETGAIMQLFDNKVKNKQQRPPTEEATNPTPAPSPVAATAPHTFFGPRGRSSKQSTSQSTHLASSGFQ